MSQRNPQNQRYINRGESYGKTRKSAASAKPKSSAASSVRTASKSSGTAATGADRAKTRQNKREARDKQWEAEQRYGDPPTKKFKIYKRIWIVGLILSVFFIIMSFVANKIFEDLPPWMMYVLLGCSYACIIIVLYIDLAKIRRMRREYAARMNQVKGKELRAQQKAERAAAREAAKLEAQKAAEQGETEDTSFKGKLKKFFQRK